MTRLHFPPLGEVAAPTHSAPVGLELTLERVDFEGLHRMINEAAEDQTKVVRALAPPAERLVTKLLGRLALLSLLGGAAAALASRSLLTRARKLKLAHTPPPAGRAAAAGTAAALASLAVLAFLTRFTYDVGAFRSPTYRGALEEVPWLIRTVQEGLAHVEELEMRLENLSRNVYDMYHRVESLQPPVAVEEADFVILHVSDIHNHPAAAGVVKELARSFAVDVVVNSGDLTDFGTRVESQIIEEFSGLGVRHLLVSGNHESPEVLAHIDMLPFIELLDARQLDVEGVRIAGAGDPGAVSASAASIPPGRVAEYAGAIEASLRATHPPPDVLVLHNYRVAEAITPGLVPVILYGHSHTAAVRFRGGTAYVNAGTTGGAGIRGLEVQGNVPITVAVVYLRRLPEGGVRVLAVDLVKLSPVAGGFTLERHMAPREEETAQDQRRLPAKRTSRSPERTSPITSLS